MYQFLKFDEIIPSCEIFELNFDEKDDKWYYIYALNTPFELTNNKDQEELIIYEYISDLILKEPNFVHGESINIKIKSLDQYIEILNKQRQVDLLYREFWKINNPDIAKHGPNNCVTLENRNYSNKELRELGIHYIATNLKQNNKICLTVFAAI